MSNRGSERENEGIRGKKRRVIQEKFLELNQFPDSMIKNKDHTRAS